MKLKTFLIFGILIFSSVSFVSAQEPGAGFTLSDFLKVSIGAKGSAAILNDMQSKCSDSCVKYDPPSDKWGKCLIICEGRSRASRAIPSLALCEYILGKAEKGELNSYVTNKSKTPEEIYEEMESRGDYSLIPFGEFGEYQTQFPNGVSYDEEKIIRDRRYECLSKLSSLSLSEDGGLCAPCEKIESREAKEECYYECQREDKEPTEAVPSPTDQEISVNGNYEKGGTLKEWKERLQSETGPDSDESKTAAECDALMKQKTAECSQHGGWRTNYMMEITDFRTDEHYEFQDIRNGGCPDTSPTGEEYPYARARDVDTAYLDSQAEAGKSEYQVVCSVLCSSWSCDVPAGTATGEIESLKGKVEVMQPDGSWKKAESGAAINLNDNIRTGKNSKAVIKLADDTTFALGHDSQFTVGDSKAESKLDFGRLKAKIKCFINTVDCYPVRFTNAVAAVRGTEYVAIADQYINTTTILVNEGTVSVTETKTGSTQDVSQGNSGVVDTSGIKVNLMPKSEWKNAAEEFDSGKNQWAVYLGFLGVLLAIGLVIYKKMKKNKDSKAVKKQSVERKKSEKSSGETKKWGIASLILSILGILFIILPYFGIILAILAVVFAIIQKKHNPTKIAAAGLIIGIIGIVLNIIVLIALAIK